MDALLAKIISVGMSVITAGLIALCKYFHSKAKKYKSLTQEKSQEEIVALVQEEVKPIIAEIHRLQDQINQLETREHNEIAAIVNSYKFRLIQLCTKFMKQNYITPDQFEQISEFYKAYVSLGGNGQAQAYYGKILNLPIQEHAFNEKEGESQ